MGLAGRAPITEPSAQPFSKPCREQRGGSALGRGRPKKYFPDQNPIGQRFTLGNSGVREVTIVGVAKNARYGSLQGAIPPAASMPFLRRPSIEMFFEPHSRRSARPEEVPGGGSRTRDQATTRSGLISTPSPGPWGTET